MQETTAVKFRRPICPHELRIQNVLVVSICSQIEILGGCTKSTFAVKVGHHSIRGLAELLVAAVIAHILF